MKATSTKRRIVSRAEMIVGDLLTIFVVVVGALFLAVKL